MSEETLNMKSAEPEAEVQDAKFIDLPDHKHEFPEYTAHNSKVVYRSIPPEEEANFGGALSVNATQEMSYEFAPNTPINLYRCSIHGKEVVSANAGAYIWYLNNWSNVQQVQFYSKENPTFKPVDIDHVGRWMRVCQSYLISKEEYEKREEHDALRLNKNGNLNPYPVSVGNSDYIGDPREKEQPVWLERSELGAALTRRFVYRLGDLKESLFAMDKFMMFPTTMVIKFKLNMTNSCFTSTSPVSPSVGYAAVTAATTYTFSDLRLKLALESDKTNIDLMREQVRMGYSFVYPSLHQYRKVPSQADQNLINWKLQNAMGLFCRKVLYAPFHPINTVRNYFNLNLSSDHGTLATMLSALEQYNTYLDNENQQNAQVMYNRLKNDASPHLENNSYEQNEPFVRHSPWINNKQKHQACFVHCDDWTDGREELALQGVALDKMREISLDIKDVATGAELAANRTLAADNQQNRDYNVYALCTRKLFMNMENPADGSVILAS